MVHSFKDKTPQIASDVFLADGTQIIGDVKIGEQSSVWFNSVIRGDMAPITIGQRTNIQDMCVIHVNRNEPVVVEDDVSIGHSVTLHGCTIKRGSLVGIGSIVLNGAVIEEDTLVAAGSLVTEHKTFPPRVLIMGSPARIVRELTAEEIESIHGTSVRYIQRAQEFR